MKTKQKNTNQNKIHRHVKRGVRLALVPHKANQFRPHLVRRYGIVVVVVLAFSLQFGYNLATTGSVLGSGAQMTVGELLADTNQQRASEGVGLLTESSRLSEAAYLKAKDMFERQYWSHEAPDGTTPWYWLGEVNYNYSHAGENLARGFRTSDAATMAWMASPEHRANILNNDYKEVGFAVVDGELDNRATTLVVALYGTQVETAIAGVEASQTTATQLPGSVQLSPITRFGIAVQSLTPASIGSVMLVLVSTIVALSAHTYRKQLPKALRYTWYRHHGLIKSAGMLSMLIILIVLYGGGQI